MENIMEITNVALKDDAVDRLSSQIHESRTATRRGFESAVPVSIAGLAQRFSGEQRAEELLDTIREGHYPHADVEDVSRLVSDPSSTSRLAQSGQGFLSQVFGNKLGGIIDALAGQSGVSRASASTLLGLAAPLVLDAVGKETESRHLDARGLSQFLSEQARLASGSLPAPLSGVVGAMPATGGSAGELKQRGRGAVAQARGRVEDAADEFQRRGRERHVLTERQGYGEARPSRVLPWILAALGLVGLIALIMAGARRSGPTTPEIQSPELPAVPAPRDPAATRQDTPRMEAPIARDPAPQAMQLIVIGPDAEPLARFLASSTATPQTFVLQDVVFEPSSAVVQPSATIDGVAVTLKRFPEARVRLQGHADSGAAAAETAELGVLRANAVRDELVKRGVPANRIETSTAPAGSAPGTGTEPAAARRVDLIVIER